MYYVYILRLSNRTFYIGSTSDLKTRFKQHRNGEERTTKKYLPCELIMYIGFNNKTRALKFERYLKTGSGFAFRNKHLV